MITNFWNPELHTRLVFVCIVAQTVICIRVSLESAQLANCRDVRIPAILSRRQSASRIYSSEQQKRARARDFPPGWFVMIFTLDFAVNPSRIMKSRYKLPARGWAQRCPFCDARTKRYARRSLAIVHEKKARETRASTLEYSLMNAAKPRFSGYTLMRKQIMDTWRELDYWDTQGTNEWIVCYIKSMVQKLTQLKRERAPNE